MVQVTRGKPMKKKILIIPFFLLLCGSLMAQEPDPVEELLNEEIEIENPVYKPVIGLSTGVLNFYGDIRNNVVNPLLGDYGYKLNVTTYIDPSRYYKLNLFFLYGNITANQSSVSIPQDNLNFRTEIVDFGFNIEYSFHHLIKKKRTLTPYLSIGIENIQFTPKGDLLNRDGEFYYYWTDGTLRNLPQDAGDASTGTIIQRDFRFETDLRDRERDVYGLGNYNKNTFAIPIDLGINFNVSERTTVKLGTSLHYTFTDFMDNVSHSGTSVKGKKGNDMFTYNYFSIHFDLFSEPKTMIVEKLFAELEFDDVMLGDEDGDFILDQVDECPGTPYGVEVDTLGCPVDDDMDGIPNYLDKEFSEPGAWVDEDGRTIIEEEYLRTLLARKEAVSREDVRKYFEIIGEGYTRKIITEVPDKFKSLDKDGDEYISFEELLQAIDSYFDNQGGLNVNDIYELNNFFFAQ
jgi:hypothetical protein